MEPTGPRGIFRLHLFLLFKSLVMAGSTRIHEGSLLGGRRPPEATRALLPRQGEAVIIHPDQAAVPGIPLGSSLSPYTRITCRRKRPSQRPHTTLQTPKTETQ